MVFYSRSAAFLIIQEEKSAAEDVYESGRKLYERKEQLAHTAFLRISKNQIVNTAKITSVRALLNGRFEAKLANGEKTIVNRHYAKAFRNHFLG
ncbi:LytTR family DNA-binding domain-containing protein [Sporosarcina koreensis]|uniref:LytTR family DNA-binding domain-containing protein n=1 Tax=Sporosarcina koreensis TaxID=334735 RepID=UPI0006935634|nr:LytTR family DNA-binding domain-containing protein [Sporosarcina koreensis]